jgi:TRAP-type C4-dicarboxylate transport system substrate-binding protein
MRHSVFNNFLLFSLLLAITAGSEAKTFKIASLAPGGSSWITHMKAAAKEISQRTNNRVKFKFYPGGIMGDDGAVLKKMRIGQLQGGAMTSGSVARFFPDIQIYSLPLAFKTFDEVDYVRKHMDQMIIDGLEKNGIITFGLTEGGLAYAMSNTPIKSVSDLQSHKIWTPSNNKPALLSLQAFDVTPVPLGIGDVLTGLQSNLIDTIATSPIGAIALQWHTQVKYITELPILYVYALLAIDKKTFLKLSPQDQQVVREVMSSEFIKISKQNRRDNLAAYQALKNQGISYIQPTSSDLDEWYRISRSATESIRKDSGMSNKAIDEFLKHINAFRLQQAKLSDQISH